MSLYHHRSDLGDHQGRGIVLKDTVGENVTLGDVLYRKNDSKWWKADADGTATMPGAGLAMQTITANNECDILLFGVYRDDTWGYTVGKILYVSCTPGPPTEVAPVGSGDQVQVVGIALTATLILFNPSYELVEIA